MDNISHSDSLAVYNSAIFIVKELCNMSSFLEINNFLRSEGYKRIRKQVEFPESKYFHYHDHPVIGDWLEFRKYAGNEGIAITWNAKNTIVYSYKESNLWKLHDLLNRLEKRISSLH